MLADVVIAKRSDAVYNMHSYLTKVPVTAIIPLIEEYCPRDGLVADPFAGSGMTAVAARMVGVDAEVSDISQLGRHIGEGYLTRVDHNHFRREAKRVVAAVRSAVGRLYTTQRESDGQRVEAVKYIWSFTYNCTSCANELVYYELLRENGWSTKELSCRCGAAFSKKGREVTGEVPVLTVVPGQNRKQIEQAFSDYDHRVMKEAEAAGCKARMPSLDIQSDREMFKRSALGKWGLSATRDFFSHRNACVLLRLWNEIDGIEDEAVRKKLRFCFTAILPRASKRYQWSHKTPLNAANQNYYIAPVFYEWNVLDLFVRKVEAAVRSDELMNTSQSGGQQNYRIASAGDLSHLADESVDLVFADPPFGSNIFYADMNLFQEAWLGAVTDVDQEAVVRTTAGRAGNERSRVRYETVLANAFSEAYRILKPGGRCCIVFGNSKGSVWRQAQRAISASGFEGLPEKVLILDKGQRSVKGLNSGHESVSTLDLIVILRKGAVDSGNIEAVRADCSSNDAAPILANTVRRFAKAAGEGHKFTASHVYLEGLRQLFAVGVDVSAFDLDDVRRMLRDHGCAVDAATGLLQRSEADALRRSQPA